MMDKLNFEIMATRLIQGAGPEKPEPEGEPDWQKIQSMFDTQVKNTFADMKQAVKDKDQKLVVFHMERILEALTKVAKLMRMRDVFLKLKDTEKKIFD